MIKYREIDIDFGNLFRIFLSGSSGSGKTHFAYLFLSNNLINYDRVYYFHPDATVDRPVQWDLKKPVIFQSGLPSKEDIFEMPRNSVIIIDDLYNEACQSSDIDFLYRVLSGKRHLHIITMTQRYFTSGKYCLNIRNCSNFHVLMFNADSTVNSRAAIKMGLRDDIRAAMKYNEFKEFPYIFIDKRNCARLEGIKIYIDIFSKYKQIVYKLMKYYLIGQKEFNTNFEKIDNCIAISKNDHAVRKGEISNGRTTAETKVKLDSPNRSTYGAGNIENDQAQKPFQEKRRFERNVRRIIQKYSKHHKL